MKLFWDAVSWLIVAVLGLFAIGEAYALLTHRMPYTERIRQYVGFEPKSSRAQWLWPTIAGVFAAFGIWFFPHIEGYW